MTETLLQSSISTQIDNRIIKQQQLMFCNPFYNILFFIIIISYFHPAMIFAAMKIHAEWNYSPPFSPVLTGFKLYQDNIPVCETYEPTSRSMDCSVFITTVSYFTITAVFSGGIESAHSSPYQFINQNENQESLIQEKIQELYIGYLGRAADQEGLYYWTREIITGRLTLEQLASNITNDQQEYGSLYGSMSREQIIYSIYLNIFMRYPDAEGLSYWTTGGGSFVGEDQLIIAFINGASVSDRQVLNNTLLVADYYTTHLGDKLNFNINQAAMAIEDVDSSQSSVINAIEIINSWINISAVSQISPQ